MTRVLILREAEGARETAASLRERGHEPLLLPVQEIVPLDAPAPAGDFGAVVVSSRNAVPALARAMPGFRGPVLAVGGATGARLGEAGFRDVRAGPGSAAELVAPAADLFARTGKPLLLALGRVRMAALEEGLAERGVAFALWEAYDTRALQPDAAAIRAACGGSPPDAAMILSEGQARAFARLAATAPDVFRPMPALLCLSARIAAALPPEFRAYARISTRRNLAALFESLASTNSMQRTPDGCISRG